MVGYTLLVSSKNWSKQATYAITQIAEQERQLASSSVITAELQVVSKNIVAKHLYSGNHATIINSYVIVVDLNGEGWEVVVSLPQFQEIEEGNYVMCDIRYSEDDEILDITIQE